MRKTIAFIIPLILALVLFGCSGETNQKQQTQGVDDEASGGELHTAISAQPPTADPHMSTAGNTKSVAINIFETIVTLNSRYEVVPMLAESWEISDDNKTYTFHLREGIKFHNGKEMKAEDVVASLNRWKEKVLLEEATFEEKDDYTVVMELESPSVLILNALADTRQFAGIMPKEVIENVSETGVQEYIGTGPFKFVEWKQDQFVHLAKYEDYQPLNSPPDGLGGKKEAFVDDLYIHFVPDDSTRLYGAESGEYDIAELLDSDLYGEVESIDNLNIINPFADFSYIVFNRKEGWFTDVKMRKAVNAALNIEEIAKAAHGEGSYRLNSSYMLKEQVDWHSEAGSEYYNNPDLEKAKELIEEAGYEDETIRILTTRDYPYLYNASVVIQEQLRSIGFKAELAIYEWATVVEKREDPGEWEIFVTSSPQVPTPVNMSIFNPDWFPGPLDEKTEGLLQAINITTSQEKISALWDELQEYSWETVPIIKIADIAILSAASTKVEGLTNLDGLILWNVKVKK